MNKRFLTFDYGASSGRGILAEFDGQQLSVREIHRFVNDPINAFGHYYWDLLRLFQEIKTGLIKLKREGITDISSMGVDTWGVDFALLDQYDKPLSNPFYYRDSLTDGAMEAVYSIIPKKEIYERTGIQFMKFNTIFQLYALRQRYPALLDNAKTLLLMPDLLNFMLTGVKSAEYSMASTTQLLDARTQQWDSEILERLDIPKDIFLPVTQPGRILGNTTDEVFAETGMRVPVASVCGHDTGSAVLAIPMEKGERCAYISCGTWSLLGVERDAPQTDDAAYAIEYTNEGGFGGTIRFLKNIMGLWIHQEVKRELEKEYGPISYAVLDAETEAAPAFARFIDPDDDVFFDKGGMIGKIRDYCIATGQTPPETRGEIFRCVLESLAFKYRYAVEQLESMLGYDLPVIRVVGGGCKDIMLMAYTARATGRRVLAGPIEATAIGNICAQMIATGVVKDVWEAREIVARSFEIKDYTVTERDGWDEQYGRFLKLIKK